MAEARQPHSMKPAQAPTYTCPMHPEVTQDQPGACPQCGMALVPQGEAHAGHDHRQMTLDMRRQWLWTNFTVMSLGVWLISSPFTFGYQSGAMSWSDVVSGAALVFFAALALWPQGDVIGRWMVALVGTWLELAPL